MAASVYRLAVNKKSSVLGEARSVAKEFLLGDDTSKKQMLVLVESWGLLKDSVIEKSITGSLRIVAAEKGYKVNEGITNYKFLTQIAEMRELTGYYSAFAGADSSFMRKHSVLFAKQDQGYGVIGVHGYGSGFYNRRKWWPALGVQQMYFAEQFTELGLPFGGNTFFRGAEDTAIGRWIFQRAASNPDTREFYYWLTLNTHLPLDERNDNAYASFRSAWKNRSFGGDVIRLTFQVKELFDSIAQQIRSGSGSGNMHILIVGDHAPPFIDPSKRGCFDSKFVPYIELVHENK
jgi:hypothetical protein